MANRPNSGSQQWQQLESMKIGPVGKPAVTKSRKGRHYSGKYLKRSVKAGKRCLLHARGSTVDLHD